MSIHMLQVLLGSPGANADRQSDFLVREPFNSHLSTVFSLLDNSLPMQPVLVILISSVEAHPSGGPLRGQYVTKRTSLCLGFSY